MAVGSQLVLSSKTDSWLLANPVKLPQLDLESMTATMSYQQPLPSAGLDVNIHSSNLMSNNYSIPQAVPPSHPLPKLSSPIRRGPSMSQKNQKMKRSMSTPNVRGQARQDPSDAALSAEKRRNKLGYHRTSVACGHCRRRKIRCIPAAADAQNRCVNCIRLKKECKFFAVDQQPQPDGVNRKDSHAQGNSASSSPSNSSRPASTMHHNMAYPHLTMPPVHGLRESGIERSRADSPSPKSKGHFARPHEYETHSNGGWMSNDPAILSKSQSNMSSAYWQSNSHRSPTTPVFPPYSPDVQQLHHSNWHPAAADQAGREEMGWSTLPQRSMSYSHHEGLNHNSGYSSFSQPGAHSSIREEFVPRQTPSQTELYSPSLTPGTNSISGTEASSTSTTTDKHTPLILQSGIPLPPPFSAPSPQNWQSHSYHYAKAPPLPVSNEVFGGWYSSASEMPLPGSVGAVAGIPVTSYGHTETYGGMYGYTSATHAGR